MIRSTNLYINIFDGWFHFSRHLTPKTTMFADGALEAAGTTALVGAEASKTINQSRSRDSSSDSRDCKKCGKRTDKCICKKGNN